MGARKHPTLLDRVIRKYGYEHKITIFIAIILDKLGKFWYNKNKESE